MLHGQAREDGYVQMLCTANLKDCLKVITRTKSVRTPVCINCRLERRRAWSLAHYKAKKK